jgi:uncharacterized caspase-like protein
LSEGLRPVVPGDKFYNPAMLRLFLTLSCAFALLVPWQAIAATAPVKSESRVALVIGNAAYPINRLRNPVNDARAMAGKLRALGFDVLLKTDISQREMTRAFSQFGEKLTRGSVGLFYYAGHAVQVQGKNFLLPIDAEIQSEASVRTEGVDVDLVLHQLALARLSMVVLDACRNNPFETRFRGTGGGLAQIDAPTGTLIAYATAPGKTADDGLAENGLYTTELLKAIERPGLPVEEVFKQVRINVLRASKNLQIPWESSSLTGEFYFRPPVALDQTETERERLRRQDAAIEQAVASAVSRSREEAEQEKKRLEQFYLEKLEAERAAFRKESLERIAAIENAAKAAVRPDGQATPAPVEPIPVDKPRVEEPREGQLPESFLLALGVDSSLRNKLLPVADEVARGLKPPPRQQGDTWTYFRQLRDGEGAERRNYFTQTVTHADPQGFVTSASDLREPTRYDTQGNRLWTTLDSGRKVIYAPDESQYRYPLAPGSTWNARHREEFPTHVVEAESQVTVVGWEEVKVPAGTFRALKLTKVSNLSGEPFPGRIEFSKRVSNLWFVPALRNFARYEVLEVNNRGAVVADQNWELDFFQLN